MLKQKNPDKTKLAYTLEEVLEFVDKLQEITLMEFDKSVKGFRPHGKTWIKSLLMESITTK